MSPISEGELRVDESTELGAILRDTRRIAARVKQLGSERGVDASVAYDGLALSL